MEKLVEVKELTEQDIVYKIYEIRCKQVMLDSDLGILYGCVNGAKTINQAVKRNINRFPEDFYFQLTKEELELVSSRSQFGTLNKSNNYRGNNVKYLPYVFTEQGVSMLSSVLRTENAAKVSVSIMRAFVYLRHNYLENKEVYQSLNNINNKLIEHEEKFLTYDKDIKLLFSKFDNKEKKESIFFDGKIYDAYSFILDIMKKAKNELIIVDAYADKSVLDMIKNLNVRFILIVKTKTLLTKLDIEKYNEEYSNLEIKYNDTFHDRYIIIDKKQVYHLGSSLNKAGTRTFNITKLEDKEVIKAIINKIKE